MKEWKKSEPSDKAVVSCAVLMKSTGILLIFGGFYPDTLMYIVKTYLDIVIWIFSLKTINCMQLSTWF